MIYNLKVKLIHKEALIPLQANPGDAGLDLFAAEEKIIKVGEAELISTGIKLELPQGTEGQVRPRSGLALRHAVTILNSPGTIDEGYRGEVKIILINHGKEDFKIEKRMRIAQLVIAPVATVNITQVEELTDSERGTRGFGSSGVK